ncbi:unnamed protein product, partial [Closterium sp. NIES-54]
LGVLLLGVLSLGELSDLVVVKLRVLLLEVLRVRCSLCDSGPSFGSSSSCRCHFLGPLPKVLEVLEPEVLELEVLEALVLEILEVLVMEILVLEVLLLEVLKLEVLEVLVLEVLEVLRMCCNLCCSAPCSGGSSSHLSHFLGLLLAVLVVLVLEVLVLEVLELEELVVLVLEVLGVLGVLCSRGCDDRSFKGSRSRCCHHLAQHFTKFSIFCLSMRSRPPLSPVLLSSPASSLLEIPDSECDFAHAASPIVTRCLATLVTDPTFESTAEQPWALRWHPRSPQAPKSIYCQGVDFFQTFSPIPKMTTLRVLLHVAAQRDYELHSLDFSTAFLQGSLHEGIWLRPPPSFTGSFPPGTQWSLWWPVYGLRQAPREWYDTLRTTLAALGFAPSSADPSLFLRTDPSPMLFYILVLSLSAPPSNDSVEPSGPYLELVGCLMYLMNCTRTDLAYPFSILARYVAPGRYRPEHYWATTRVMRYLYYTLGMGLVLRGRCPVVLIGHSDAFKADDQSTQRADDQATKRSSQGYNFRLGTVSVSRRYPPLGLESLSCHVSELASPLLDEAFAHAVVPSTPARTSPCGGYGCWTFLTASKTPTVGVVSSPPEVALATAAAIAVAGGFPFQGMMGSWHRSLMQMLFSSKFHSSNFPSFTRQLVGLKTLLPEARLVAPLTAHRAAPSGPVAALPGPSRPLVAPSAPLAAPSPPLPLRGPVATPTQPRRRPYAASSPPLAAPSLPPSLRGPVAAPSGLVAAPTWHRRRP